MGIRGNLFKTTTCIRSFERNVSTLTGGQTLVGRLSGIRAQSGLVATKGATTGGPGTLVKPPCLRGIAGRAPSFEVFPSIRLTTEEKSRKTLSQGIRKVPAGHDSFCQLGGHGCCDRL